MKLTILILFVAIAFYSCNQKSSKLTIKPESFHQTVDGLQVDLFFLKNKNGLEMAVTNYGGRVVSLLVPDKNGKMEDVVLGYESLDGYLKADEEYFGASIGRYGNRIAKGSFKLDSVEYKLAINNTPNSLHGGINGFSKKVWSVVQKGENELELGLVSLDMEEGYPGELKVTVTYKLTDQNEFAISYRAETTKPTVLNLTNHSYFNFHGAGNGDILDHVLQLNADNFTPVDSTLIPIGKIVAVTGTPFDFSKPVAIGARINDQNEQLRFGLGYDHNFVINKTDQKAITLAASVYDPQSGRFMEVFTNEPGVQFYCGNFLKGINIGKQGKTYKYRSAFCLETQHFPDSPNQPEFPSVVLRPGQTYNSECVYKFSVK
ncbi:MAG: aldose epimerase family protein [Mariniphaga sp.]